MASYDKIIKYLVEKLQTALAPLEQIARTQNTLVAQHKQIIELLSQQNGGRLPTLPQAEDGSPAETPADDTPAE